MSNWDYYLSLVSISLYYYYSWEEQDIHYLDKDCSWNQLSNKIKTVLFETKTRTKYKHDTIVSDAFDIICCVLISNSCSEDSAWSGQRCLGGN